MQARTPFLKPGILRRAGSGISQPPPDPDFKSAARLAAEAAFSVSRQLITQEPAPAVSVRRGKVIGMRPTANEAVLAADGPTGDPAIGQTGTKGPRVFRLAQPVLDASTGASGTPLAGPDRDTTDAKAPAQMRKKNKRVAVEHRPGPVLQIFRAPESGLASGGRTNAGEDNAISPRQLAVLAELLASVEPILQDIQRARAMRF